MRFVLSVQGGSDTKFAQGAVVVLHKKDREQLLRRRALFLGILAYEPELVYMDYADNVDWVESFSDPELATLVDTNYLLQDPAPFRAPVGEMLRVEWETCIIDRCGVLWSCLVKHTEVQLETHPIPWYLIEGKE
jgi:hypothetical protein